MGSGGGPAQPAWPGREWPGVGGRRDLHTPQPSPQAPRARMHARPPGQWGVLEAPRAPGPGQALAGLVLAVFGGRAGVSRLESGRGSCGSNTARPLTRGAARWPDLHLISKLSLKTRGTQSHWALWGREVPEKKNVCGLSHKDTQRCPEEGRS